MLLTRSTLLALLMLGAASCQSYDDDYQAPQKEQQFEQLQQRQENQQPEAEGALGTSNGVDASVPEPPSQIPETSFVCEGLPYDPGMYADQETGCRVYHMCFMNRKEDFICGTGTIFNQETLTCDYPANVDCDASPSFYSSNENFGKGAPEPGGDSQGARGGARPPPRAQTPRPQAPAPRAPGAQAPRPQTPGPRPAGPRPSVPRAQLPAQDDFYDDDALPVARPGPGPAPRPGPGPAPRPVGKPNVAPRPVAQPRPQPARPAPVQPRPAPRPAPAPRVNVPYSPPSKVNPAPRPVSRPGPAPQPSYRPPAPTPSKTRPRPADRPRPVVPRPTQRPIVQTQDDQDYEPSILAPQRSSPVGGRRGVASFRPQSQRWQMMSQNY